MHVKKVPPPPNQPALILGHKVGMTRYYTEAGKNVPVTVIKVGPCFVSQVKTIESDGYNALQIAFEDVKARNSTFPVIGHDGKAGLAPKRHHQEIRCGDDAPELELGAEITAESFADVKYVDVTGVSKGKGFAGAMKRHGFKGKEATHGVERKHRSPGSIGGRSSNLGTGKPKKGIRMAGHMGSEQVTVRSLEIIKILPEEGVLLVKGPVPGPRHGMVSVRQAKRLFKRKLDA